MSKTVSELQAAAAELAEQQRSFHSDDMLPGTLGVMNDTDAVMHVLVVSATQLKNKRMLGAQDVSFTIAGMMQDARASKTLEDCGVDATFNQMFQFPWRGNTQASCVLNVTLWKEDGAREQLGRAELNTLKYRRTFAAVEVDVPITDQGNAAGTLRVRIHTHDPAHEVERAHSDFATSAVTAAETERGVIYEHNGTAGARQIIGIPRVCKQSISAVHSVAVGPGLRPTVCARVPTHVNVLVCDEKGEPIAEVDESVLSASLFNEALERVPVEVSRVESSGALRVTYTPLSIGVHRLAIAVGGAPIAGSPWYSTVGIDVEAMRAVGMSLPDIKVAGAMVRQLKIEGCTAAELRAAGYTLAELKAGGLTARELGAPGARFTFQELRDAGFTHTAKSAQDMQANHPNSFNWGVGSGWV